MGEKFKVGDRVVEDKSQGCGDDLISHWNRFWRLSEGELTNGEFVVTRVTDKTVHYSNREDGYGPQIEERYLNLAPLRIEAGKFYKTRDGRKAGPIAYDEYGLYGADGFSSKAWYENGQCFSDGREYHDDLIAEWVDEPAAQPAAPVAATASNDNAAPAKFKVGDVVRSLVDWNDTRVGDILPVTTVCDDGVWATDRLGDDTYLEYDEIEPANAPTVAPQQSTAGFTIPLFAEPTTTDLTLSIGIDAADLHDELDEIIAKLKKIRKLQRQTGLAA